MKSRTLVAVALGVMSVACAAGVFEGPSSPSSSFQIEVEKSAGEGSRGQISGLLIDEDAGEGVSQGVVVLSCQCLPASRETTTNHNGAYAFKDLPPGTYSVAIYVGSHDLSRMLTLEAGDLARIRTRFRPSIMPVIT